MSGPGFGKAASQEGRIFMNIYEYFIFSGGSSINTNPGRHKFGGATQRAGETTWTPSFYPWSFVRIPKNCPTSGIIITEMMEYQVQGSAHPWVIPIPKEPEGLSGHHTNKKPHDIISLEEGQRVWGGYRTPREQWEAAGKVPGPAHPCWEEI